MFKNLKKEKFSYHRRSFLSSLDPKWQDKIDKIFNNILRPNSSLIFEADFSISGGFAERLPSLYT